MADDVKSGELVPAGAQDLAADIPDFLREEMEHFKPEVFNPEDVIVPRIRIAQSMSRATKPVREEYIPGLAEGEFYNNLTKQNYGPGPLYFAIVKREPKPRFVIFDKEFNLVEADVPPDDPRTQWTKATPDEIRPSIKPVATKMYDYVIVLLDTMQPVLMSLASTAIKAAKQLNGLISYSGIPVPTYARRFVMTTRDKNNTQNVWKIPVFANADIVRSPEQLKALKQMHETFAGLSVLDMDRDVSDIVNSEVSPVDDQDIPF